MQSHYQYIIVGAGSAAVAAIKSIRQNTHTPILVITNEDRLPYKRTQINKLMDKGFSKDEFAIFSKDELMAKSIDLLFGEAQQIIPSKNMLVVKDGTVLQYDKLLLATGHNPKTYLFHHIPAEKHFTIYNANDAERLMAHATDKKSYFILGGGVEGIEMAHQLHVMGKKVTLIHRSEHLMHKELSIETSNKLKELLLKHEIDLIHSPNINEDQFCMVDQKILFTHNAISHFAEGIVCCIGSMPNTEIATRCGLKAREGILVDGFFRTSAPNVFAAGSVAELPNAPQCHLWHHAEHQGHCAGVNMSGLPMPYEPKAFRLKADVFGEHYFSANYANIKQADEMVYQENGPIYRELYFKDNKLFAIVMTNDKARAKQYQSAIWESWTMEEVMQKLPL